MKKKLVVGIFLTLVFVISIFAVQSVSAKNVKLLGVTGLILNSEGNPAWTQQLYIKIGSAGYTVQCDTSGHFYVYYKHIGKPIDYEIRIFDSGGELIGQGTLKSNGLVEFNYQMQ